MYIRRNPSLRNSVLKASNPISVKIVAATATENRPPPAAIPIPDTAYKTIVDGHKSNNRLAFDWQIHFDDLAKKYSDLDIKVGKKAFENSE